jgi:hypothetical protein
VKRQLLGELLIQSMYITEHQLDQAIAEQQPNEKIGQVFKRLGLLTDYQLLSLLNYQTNPLKIGQLLVTSGEITSNQLHDALHKQTISGKKLGQVLVDEGYISEHKISHTLSIQKSIITAALLTILSSSVSEATTVQLQWDANPETESVAGYIVYYAPFSSQLIGGTRVDVKAPLTTSTITNLDPYMTYQFAVTAYNTAGESEFSNIVILDATPIPTDITSPIVSITTPASNIKVKGIVTINVNASDNIGVSRVDIYNGTTLLYAGNATPYSLNWNTTTVPDGAYVLTAKAYDVSGNIGQSTNIDIIVNNIPILPVITTGIKLVLN